MILSKHPMKYIDHIIYEAAQGYDAATNKGCVIVEIDINNKKWLVAGTHLQASGQHIRDEQYKQIKNYIIDDIFSLINKVTQSILLLLYKYLINLL